MHIEFQTRMIPEVACDLLACPVFENHDREILRTLDRVTRGVVASVLESGEFKPEFHRTCLIHRPPHLKAQRFLLIGAGKEQDFSPA